MSESLHKLLTLLISSPYPYLFVLSIIVVFVGVVLLILFHKQILSLAKQFFSKCGNGFKIQITKKHKIAFDTKDKESVVSKGTVIQQVEMTDSGIDSIKGHITIDNVKMKNSHIGNIRSD